MSLLSHSSKLVLKWTKALNKKDMQVSGWEVPSRICLSGNFLAWASPRLIHFYDLYCSNFASRAPGAGKSQGHGHSTVAGMAAVEGVSGRGVSKQVLCSTVTSHWNVPYFKFTFPVPLHSFYARMIWTNQQEALLSRRDTFRRAEPLSGVLESKMR